MKVAIVQESFAVGGAERAGVMLARSVSLFAEVHMFVTVDKSGIMLPSDLRCFVRKDPGSLLHDLICFKYDAIIFNNCRMCLSVLSKLNDAKEKRFKLYSYTHGFTKLSMDMTPYGTGFDSVIAISDEVKAGILSIEPRWQEINVIKNYVDSKVFTPSKSEYAIDGWEDKPVFGYCGRISTEKGLIPLLVSFVNVRKVLKDARLLLVGGIDTTGPFVKYWQSEYNSFKKVADSFGLHEDDDYMWTGVVNDPEQYYKLMDVFCLASMYEGMPFVILEAMASGLPCVCTNVGNIKAVIGNSGFTVSKVGQDLNETEMKEFSDKMLLAYMNKKELGKIARKRSLKYCQKDYDLAVERVFNV